MLMILPAVATLHVTPQTIATKEATTRAKHASPLRQGKAATSLSLERGRGGVVGGGSVSCRQERLHRLHQQTLVNRLGEVIIAAGGQRLLAVAIHGVRRKPYDGNLFGRRIAFY